MTTRSDPGVRAHYRDLYDGPPAGDTPLVTILGNCQAESLRLMLAAPDVRTARIPPVHELTHEDLAPLRRLLARTDLLVAQPVAEGYRGLPLGTAQVLEHLPAHARHALVPSLRYAGLYPHHVLVHPPGLELGDPPVVPYHDLRTVVAAAWARSGRAAPEPPPLTAEAVVTVAAASVAELTRREVGHRTVVVSDLVTTLADRIGFATMRTINHPGNELLAAVAVRLRDRLGLDPAPPGVTRPLLDALHAPRDPVVAGLLDPPAEPRSTWLVRGREVSQHDVTRAHLEWYAAHPVALDEALRRTAPTRAALGLVTPG